MTLRTRLIRVILTTLILAALVAAYAFWRDRSWLQAELSPARLPGTYSAAASWGHCSLTLEPGGTFLEQVHSVNESTNQPMGDSTFHGTWRLLRQTPDADELTVAGFKDCYQVAGQWSPDRPLRLERHGRTVAFMVSPAMNVILDRSAR